MFRGMLQMDMVPAPTAREQPAPDQPVDGTLRLALQGLFANDVDVQVAVGVVRDFQDDVRHCASSSGLWAVWHSAFMTLFMPVR